MNDREIDSIQLARRYDALNYSKDKRDAHLVMDGRGTHLTLKEMEALHQALTIALQEICSHWTGRVTTTPSRMLAQQAHDDVIERAKRFMGEA